MGHGKTSDTERNWDHGQVELSVIATVYHVATLHGGESITIKARSGNSGMAYVGSDKLLKSSNGFELDASESVTLTLPITFGINNFINIFATGDYTADDLCWVKLIGLFPSTEASAEAAAKQ